MAETVNTVPTVVVAGLTRAGDDMERAREISRRLSLPLEDLSEYRMDPELFRQIPIEVMLRYQFVPMHRQGDVVVIAMADPSNVFALDEVELALGSPVEVQDHRDSGEVRVHSAGAGRGHRGFSDPAGAGDRER